MTQGPEFKKKRHSCDYIEMKVFSVFKQSVKPKDTKILEKVNMTNMIDKGLMSLIHTFKSFNLKIH